MDHLINLDKIIKEIADSNRPACQWTTKGEAIELIKEHAKPINKASNETS